jgi:trans-2,3-dihydro-3-hydroxyanthranilate isomerase
MARHEYLLVDVFTSQRFGGNPLAVFPDARQIAPELMPRIARELNLSETTFVLPSERQGCDVRVRIFTPGKELPVAGHPTIGTAFVLDRGERLVFEEGVGPVPVWRERLAGGSRWWMSLPPPSFTPIAADRAQVAAALGLSPADLAPDLPLEIGSSGVPLVYVPLRDLDALARARLDTAAWDRLPIPGTGELYPFVITGPASVRARMFAPQLGVMEDPATGSACGPLGGYLLRYQLLNASAGRPTRAVCEQGHEMGRPSSIFIELTGPEDRVHVGGDCVPVGGGWMDL